MFESWSLPANTISDLTGAVSNVAGKFLPFALLMFAIILVPGIIELIVKLVEDRANSAENCETSGQLSSIAHAEETGAYLGEILPGVIAKARARGVARAATTHAEVQEALRRME